MHATIENKDYEYISNAHNEICFKYNLNLYLANKWRTRIYSEEKICF